MPSRVTPFVSGSFYHIFNRGVNKQDIFSIERDYQRFLETLFYYQFTGPKPRFSTHKRFKNKDFSNNPKIVEVICCCLMPNHFHLLIKQIRDNGILEFMSKVLNSYTKYFNTKHRRSGRLMGGEFKSVCIENEQQLLHVSRYIHLNPYVSDLAKDLKLFPYSSYLTFIGTERNPLYNTEPILESFQKNSNLYEKFVVNHQDYAKSLEIIKHLVIDE